MCSVLLDVPPPSKQKVKSRNIFARTWRHLELGQMRISSYIILTNALTADY